MRQSASPGNTALVGRGQAQHGMIKKCKPWFILIVFVFGLKPIFGCLNWEVSVRGLVGSGKDLLGHEGGSQRRQRGIFPSPSPLPPICCTHPWGWEQGLRPLWVTTPHHLVSVQHIDSRLVTQDWASYVLRMLQIIKKQYYSLMTADLPL